MSVMISFTTSPVEAQPNNIAVTQLKSREQLLEYSELIKPYLSESSLQALSQQASKIAIAAVTLWPNCPLVQQEFFDRIMGVKQTILTTQQENQAMRERCSQLQLEAAQTKLERKQIEHETLQACVKGEQDSKKSIGNIESGHQAHAQFLKGQIEQSKSYLRETQDNLEVKKDEIEKLKIELEEKKAVQQSLRSQLGH